MQTAIAAQASTIAECLSSHGVVSKSASLRCKGMPSLSTRRSRAFRSVSTRAVSEQERIAAELSKLAQEAQKKVQEVAQQTNEVIEKLNLEEVKTELEEKAVVAAQQLKAQAEIAAKEISVQANIAQQELSTVIQKVQADPSHITELTKDAPAPIRELASTAVTAHSAEAARKGAVIHDFCLGITYGFLLIIGGFLWFLLTGSVNALRFGIILGGGLTAAGFGSLQAWKKGVSTVPYTAAQAALTVVLFARNAARYSSTGNVFPTGLNASVSLFMLAFYVYVLLVGNKPKAAAA